MNTRSDFTSSQLDGDEPTAVGRPKVPQLRGTARLRELVKRGGPVLAGLVAAALQVVRRFAARALASARPGASDHGIPDSAASRRFWEAAVLGPGRAMAGAAAVDMVALSGARTAQLIAAYLQANDDDKPPAALAAAVGQRLDRLVGEGRLPAQLGRVLEAARYDSHLCVRGGREVGLPDGDPFAAPVVERLASWTACARMLAAVDAQERSAPGIPVGSAPASSGQKSRSRTSLRLVDTGVPSRGPRQ